MCVRPHVKLNSVHPGTEIIRPQYLHLELILAIVTELPLSSCRLQATGKPGYQQNTIGFL